MIKVPQDQMAQLDAAADDRFIRSALPHLKRYGPPLGHAGEERGLEAAVRTGLEKARRFGFNEGPQVLLFLELTMLFGCGFDDDPQYCWLRPFLTGMDGVPARERARLLYWHSNQFLDRAFGAAGEHGITAGKRASMLRKEYFDAVGQDFSNLGPRLLTHVHAERMAYLDATSTRDLMTNAAAEARRFALTDSAGAPLLLLLMFAFGHRVTEDPLYPWARAILTDSQLASQVKVDRLLQRAHGCLVAILRQAKVEIA